MGKGDWRGEVRAPELSEKVESPNKTYLFHMCSVCALCAWVGREPLVGGSLGNSRNHNYGRVGTGHIGDTWGAHLPRRFWRLGCASDHR